MKYLIISICIGLFSILPSNQTIKPTHDAAKSNCIELVYKLIKSTPNYQKMVDETAWSEKKIKSKVEYSLNPKKDKASYKKPTNYYCIAFQEGKKDMVFTLTRFVFFPSSMKLYQVDFLEDNYDRPLKVNSLLLEEFKEDCK